MLMATNYELSEDVALKNVVALMTCVIKDDCNFFPQLFLEEA